MVIMSNPREDNSYIVNQLTIFICLNFANDKDVGFIRSKLFNIAKPDIQNVWKIYRIMKQQTASESIKKLCFHFIQNFYLYYL